MPSSIDMIIKKSKETCPAAKQPSLKMGGGFSKLPQKCSVTEWSVAKYRSTAEAHCLFFISKQGDNTVTIVLCYAWVFRPASSL